MSLLHFLKLGSSLAKVRETSSYHLAKKQALPTFGNAKPVAETVAKPANPFAAAAKNSAAEQAELSLEKVKVVRNDLADADIALVPKAPPGTTMPAKRYQRPKAQPDELGKKAWGLLGTRLFGAAAKH